MSHIVATFALRFVRFDVTIYRFFLLSIRLEILFVFILLIVLIFLQDFLGVGFVGLIFDDLLSAFPLDWLRGLYIILACRGRLLRVLDYFLGGRLHQFDLLYLSGQLRGLPFVTFDLLIVRLYIFLLAATGVRSS